MHALMRILRIACLAGGLVGMLVSVWALIDPSALPGMAGGHGMMGAPPSPRWRAVLAFVVSLLVAGYGAGILRHRELP